MTTKGSSVFFTRQEFYKQKTLDTHKRVQRFRTPGGIQTHDLQNRNLTFYSAELRGHLRPAEHSANAGAKVQKYSE